MKISLDNYREYPAISYSLLAALDRDPKNLVTKQDEYTDAMRMGNIVDILITDPKEFDKKYIVANIHYPSDNIKEIIDSISLAPDLRLEDCGDIIKAKAKELNYGQSWKPETVVEKVVKEGLKYFQFLLEAGDKEIISNEEYMKCSKLSSNILTSEFTCKYFQPDLDISREYQLPLLMEYQDKYLIKSLLDKVIFNHKAKIIFPFDIKTMQESIYSFPSKFLKWRYDIQASLYTEQLKHNYPDYKVAPFKFIVGSFSDNKVLLYNAKNYLEPAKYGFKTKYGKEYKGWLQLLEDYDWHNANLKYEYRRDVYALDGEIMLEIDETEGV